MWVNKVGKRTKRKCIGVLVVDIGSVLLVVDAFEWKSVSLDIGFCHAIRSFGFVCLYLQTNGFV